MTGIDSFFWWVGVVTSVVATVGLLLLLWLILSDLYVCTIYVINRLKGLEHGGYRKELPLIPTAIWHVFSLVFGSARPTPWLYDEDRNTIVFWPGKETSDLSRIPELSHVVNPRILPKPATPV